ncbi:nuclear-pore anchor-like [Magnolia sinica]|uniref:nuclear-pore anchor-like n=1 Tax=Magnolia sinica TaxID=86752 RepID=UPI00265A052F|nr:nuclear-pore anchor-like [Magnolia sinica]
MCSKVPGTCLHSPSANEQQRKKNDQQRLLKFMTDHQPHVVILGAVNLNCKCLKDDIYEADKLKKSVEDEIHFLKGRVSELESDLVSKCIEVTSVVSRKEEALSSAFAEIDRLKEENSIKT